MEFQPGNSQKSKKVLLLDPDRRIFSQSTPNMGNQAPNLETESPILETGSPIVKQVPQFGKPDPPFMKPGPAPLLDPFRKPGPPIRETIFETWSPFWKT